MSLVVSPEGQGRRGVSLKPGREMFKLLVLPAHCEGCYRRQLLFKTLQITDEPLTSSVHTPPPTQAHFTLTDINAALHMSYIRKTDPQNPKLQSVRCQPSQSTLGQSTGLLSSGSLTWARLGWAACSLPSTPPAPGSLGGGGGGLLGPCLA